MNIGTLWPPSTMWDSPTGGPSIVTHIYKNLGQHQCFLHFWGATFLVHTLKTAFSFLVHGGQGRIPFGSLGLRRRGNDPFMLLTYIHRFQRQRGSPSFRVWPCFSLRLPGCLPSVPTDALRFCAVFQAGKEA